MLPVSRKSLYYTRSVVIPIFLLTCASFIAFFMETSQLSDRCGITLTMLLTTVAYKLVIDDKIPKLAYSTTLDFYIDGSFFTILAVCLENVIAFKCPEVENNVAYVICGIWVVINMCFTYSVAAIRSQITRTVGPALMTSLPQSAVNRYLQEIESAFPEGVPSAVALGRVKSP